MADQRVMTTPIFDELLNELGGELSHDLAAATDTHGTDAPADDQDRPPSPQHS